jgi:antirestriction protein
MNDTQEAFFYVDGIPTKGAWIDLEDVTDTDDVLEALADAGVIERNADDTITYGGDLLVADVDGVLAKHFLSKYGTFDLSGCLECMSECESRGISFDAAAAYINHFGTWSRDTFEEAYQGEWDSEVDFAENLFDELYLHELPSHVQSYIDYEKYARDIFIDGYTFEDGYVFRTDC